MAAYKTDHSTGGVRTSNGRSYPAPYRRGVSLSLNPESPRKRRRREKVLPTYKEGRPLRKDDPPSFLKRQQPGKKETPRVTGNVGGHRKGNVPGPAKAGPCLAKQKKKEVPKHPAGWSRPEQGVLPKKTTAHRWEKAPIREEEGSLSPGETIPGTQGGFHLKEKKKPLKKKKAAQPNYVGEYILQKRG